MADPEDGRVGIDDGEGGRPHRLLQINRVRHQRVRQPRSDRYSPERNHRLPLGLGDIRDDAGDRGQPQQRGLFPYPPENHRHGEPPLFGNRRAFPRHAPQRPPIQQKKHEGQCHQHRLAHQPQREEHEHGHVPPDGRPPDIPKVGAHRQQPEQRAEHILPLRHPRHRLHVQRMHREQGRDERAPPQPSRHPPQDQEQQRRVRQVEQHVHPVMPPGVQAEQLHVGHVRNPGQGMPVRRFERRERPGNTLLRQASLDVKIFPDILTVIVVDERKASHLPENKKDQEG